MGETLDLNLLKQQINNFLWTALPPNVTLGEAEQIALDLCDRIASEWSKHSAEAANG